MISAKDHGPLEAQVYTLRGFTQPRCQSTTAKFLIGLVAFHLKDEIIVAPFEAFRISGYWLGCCFLNSSEA